MKYLAIALLIASLVATVVHLSGDAESAVAGAVGTRAAALENI